MLLLLLLLFQVADAFCDGDPARMRKVKARFSRPVMPGQTLV